MHTWWSKCWPGTQDERLITWNFAKGRVEPLAINTPTVSERQDEWPLQNQPGHKDWAASLHGRISSYYECFLLFFPSFTLPSSQVHMLLLPFLPITALIMQNATTLSTLLTYQVRADGMKGEVRYLEILWDHPKRRILYIFYKLKVFCVMSSDFLFVLERGWENWSQSGRGHPFGEVHHKHAKGAIRGDLGQCSNF